MNTKTFLSGVYKADTIEQAVQLFKEEHDEYNLPIERRVHDDNALNGGLSLQKEIEWTEQAFIADFTNQRRSPNKLYVYMSNALSLSRKMMVAGMGQRKSATKFYDKNSEFLIESYEHRAVILEYQGEAEVVRVEPTVAGYPLYSIRQGAFDKERSTKLLKVEIPVTIPKIEEGAFSKDIEVIRYFNKDMGGFEYEGMWITEPSMDETGRFDVNPLKYYGITVENE